jgi:hypothetical protein
MGGKNSKEQPKINFQSGVASFLPMPILSDSYKPSHYLQYPKSKKFVAVSLIILF